VKRVFNVSTILVHDTADDGAPINEALW